MTEHDLASPNLTKATRGRVYTPKASQNQIVYLHVSDEVLLEIGNPKPAKVTAFRIAPESFLRCLMPSEPLIIAICAAPPD